MSRVNLHPESEKTEREKKVPIIFVPGETNLDFDVTHFPTFFGFLNFCRCRHTPANQTGTPEILTNDKKRWREQAPIAT